AHAESYKMYSSSDGVTISSPTPTGSFYGAQTLMQMLSVDANGAFIPAAKITDYPSLDFRGVHLFTGNDMPLQRKLVENVFSRFKFNHLVLEAQYGEWKTAPKLATKDSLPQEQLREYVKLARANFLEPIPLVQSLGHAEWMFQNGQNHE